MYNIRFKKHFRHYLVQTFPLKIMVVPICLFPVSSCCFVTT